jgi:hypothetical protein
MKEKSVVNQIKALLGIEVKLEQMTLENGTVIEAEMFEAGQAVFIATEDGNVPLPVGEYELPDNMMLVVSEEGIISEMKAAEAEAEVEAEKEVEVEASEEAPEFVTKADFEAAISEIKSLFSKQEKEVEVKEEVKEEVKVEASAEEMPAAKAIKPNPEKSEKKKIEFKQTNKASTTESRVFAKLANFK